MIDPDHDLSITAQAKLLGISRANVYYPPSDNIAGRPCVDAPH